MSTRDALDPDVDVTLIDAALALTPLERIRENDRVLRQIEELRHGISRARNAAANASVRRR
jgi:hypothetical protein